MKIRLELGLICGVWAGGNLVVWCRWRPCVWALCPLWHPLAVWKIPWRRARLAQNGRLGVDMGFSPCHKWPGVSIMFWGSQQRPSLFTGCRARGNFPKLGFTTWSPKQKGSGTQNVCQSIYIHQWLGWDLCLMQSRKQEGSILIHETVKQ